ncbi:hypothetical protein FIBSPDRAFT_862577 [Athelia psychrophila]|uniref:Uncharacterized protein n=1 Tax=Athelia psychrophila TaxID=1759441 RepID=A0A166I182_9AGAM|nr:hypothetical protein FIBSPDRAFT_862577 [Fibularhizoctonia sp. CBS 109695]
MAACPEGSSIPPLREPLIPSLPSQCRSLALILPPLRKASRPRDVRPRADSILAKPS